MKVFVAVLFVILGLLFVAFFIYELACLVRDIRKHLKKKKESNKDKSEDTNKK